MGQASAIGGVGARRGQADRDPLRGRRLAGSAAGQLSELGSRAATRPRSRASPGDSRAAAERAARESYGRLLAVLAATTHDLALAEDALADAFETALRAWPLRGVPENPEGWLVTVARNRIRDVFRSAAARRSVPLEDDLAATFSAPDRDAIPDRRLELLFACAHPAVHPSVRTPLLLQVVLGCDAARIAQAFALPPAAMAQRLVRAKHRIRD
ncbi:MAG: hypothetical protein KGL16_02815, partial [Acidobacteriota bacterium]|nr:hypothetical protein [Acidobacteriota bacterium]